MRSGFSAIRARTQSRSRRHKVRPATAHPQRGRTADGALALRPLHNAGDADHERLGHRTAGLTRRDRRHHTLPQVQRISSRHPRWPPNPASRLNLTSRPLGNPLRFSQSRSRSSTTLKLAAIDVLVSPARGAQSANLVQLTASALGCPRAVGRLVECHSPMRPTGARPPSSRPSPCRRGPNPSLDGARHAPGEKTRSVRAALGSIGAGPCALSA